MIYAKSLYKSTTLAAHAIQYYRALPEKVDTLLCSGSSGMALASAIAMLAYIDNRILYVVNVKHPKHSFRDDADSHSGHKDRINNITSCIVDDYLDSGVTIDGIISLTNNIFGFQDAFTPGYIMVCEVVCRKGNREEELKERYPYTEIIELQYQNDDEDLRIS